MKYSVNIDKAINRLVPHYLSGRKFILLIQSICSPLKSLNEWFCDYAQEKKIEAAMTSQVIMLEWYLNRQFKVFFKNNQEYISISDSEPNGTPIFWEINPNTDDTALYNESEDNNSTFFRFVDENDRNKRFDFVVNLPQCNDTISQQEYINMVKYVIEKYRLTSVTYTIIIK